MSSQTQSYQNGNAKQVQDIICFRFGTCLEKTCQAVGVFFLTQMAVRGQISCLIDAATRF